MKYTFAVRIAVAAMLIFGACASGSETTDAPRDGAGLGWATHSLTHEDGVPTAALTGRIVDVGGCLIVTDATASVHVAALPADADFEAGVVTIGTESVRLGEPVTVGGARLPPRTAACYRYLMLVRSQTWCGS